jgi:hypothetical protein
MNQCVKVIIDDHHIQRIPRSLPRNQLRPFMMSTHEEEKVSPKMASASIEAAEDVNPSIN